MKVRRSMPRGLMGTKGPFKGGSPSVWSNFLSEGHGARISPHIYKLYVYKVKINKKIISLDGGKCEWKITLPTVYYHLLVVDST